MLSTGGLNTPVAAQPLAGNVALPVPLSSSNRGAGTVPSTASIPGGQSSGAFTFTPVAAGMTTVQVTQPTATPNWPNGFTVSGLFAGSLNLNQFVATVQ